MPLTVAAPLRCGVDRLRDRVVTYYYVKVFDVRLPHVRQHRQLQKVDFSWAGAPKRKIRLIVRAEMDDHGAYGDLDVCRAAAFVHRLGPTPNVSLPIDRLPPQYLGTLTAY